MAVLGVDGCPGGWVGALLAGNAVLTAITYLHHRKRP